MGQVCFILMRHCLDLRCLLAFASRFELTERTSRFVVFNLLGIFAQPSKHINYIGWCTGNGMCWRKWRAMQGADYMLMSRDPFYLRQLFI